jgi:aldose 1-epimerase
MPTGSIAAGLALGMTLLSMPNGAWCADFTRSTFGRLPDGRTVEAIELRNSHGMAVRIIALGAIVQSLAVPDRDGRSADVVLGYASAAEYATNPQYFGVTVGRFAGRLAKGRFTLDGKTYQVGINDEPNSLHGGIKGFGKALWTVDSVSRGAAAGVTLSYTSRDGEEGYPGTLQATAAFRLTEQNELQIEYRATTDKPTIVNMTNHSYFNLGGEGTAGGVSRHLLMLPAEQYLPLDAALIPTGEIRAVAGTAFDFRSPKPMGRDIRNGRDVQIMNGHGYDHTWVVSRIAAQTPRLVARIEDPGSGRVLEILSDQPGVHFYSANSLDGTIIGKSGHTYRQDDGFAVEPGRLDDTPNRPAFGSARLAPGEVYLNRIVFRFSVAAHP